MRQLLFLILLFSAVICRAQEFSGRITDETGMPVPGGSVMIKGTHTGVSSNENGQFKITLTKLPAVLTFTAVGYKSYETKITTKTNRSFNVVLLSERGTLDEVVVTGYGSSKRKAEFGYSTTVTGSSFTREYSEGEGGGDYHSFPKSASGTSFKTAVEGKAAGVMVTRVPAAADKYVFVGDSTEVTNNARARMLTAGEVNDFKKWKMWEDFNETEFRRHSEYWGLTPTHRYTVQLQNQFHKALVGKKVYLYDEKRKDYVWTAITDNTGKAELWAAMDAKEESSYMIVVEGEKQSVKATSFANGINIIQLDQSCGASKKVQISFVVDATGSMGDEIAYMKEELEDVITKTFEKNETLDLEMSAVFYRDKGDEYVTRKNDFDGDILSTVNFIKMQQAGGGGDYPEALNEALRTAIDDLKWDDNARTRIMFIILDAPPHEDAKAEMLLLMRKAAQKGIRVVPIVCSGTDKSTEFLMRSIALATNGTYLFLTDNSGIGGSHIKPTTDSYSVELLNDLLQRTIEQMAFVVDCNTETKTKPVAAPVDPHYTPVTKLKVYPNPTQGMVVVETTNDLKEMYVADFSGKLLMKIDVAGKKRIEFDLTAYPSATYFIRYITTEGKSGAEKIILVH